MKRLVIALAAACMAVFASAQDKTARRWSDGPLSWSEFRPADSSSAEGSFAHITWEKELKRMTHAGVRYSYNDYYAVFNRDFSYCAAGADTQEALKYHQGVFDINEKYARRYRDSLLLGSERDSQKAFRKIKAECALEVSGFTDSAGNFVTTLPSDTFRPYDVAFDPMNGLSFGLGMMLRQPVKSPDVFSVPMTALSFATAYTSGRHSVILDVALPLSGGTFSSQALRYGYSFLTGSFSMRGFAGFALSRYVFAPSVYNESSIFEMHIPSAQVGFDFDCAMKKYVSFNKVNPDFTEIRLFAGAYADACMMEKSPVVAICITAGVRVDWRLLQLH